MWKTICNTRLFLENLIKHISKVVTCFYEEAPPGASFPFAVVSGEYITELNQGDNLEFYLEIFADEKAENSTVEMEDLASSLRAHLNNAIIAADGRFSSHIGFENQKNTFESEPDLCHRRQTYTARIFYVGG